ncbi:phosphopantothenoylcysteine decarboxylase-like [Anneissia japonica]|uniref:phosphopantothenoylcysteine decarboxylase-like n=1 Tax=Anneissia japonica TaxID=1529436 RepID=UPI0014255840|nr:phosphopantothenoylcysteine decarboxylase-like [Anneissia japonica]XP_033099260.1 phosphopantothenoylcysteine decarboxylase-like [Anneissia japonica]
MMNEAASPLSRTINRPIKHLLVGCTGSVASIKIPQLVTELCKLNQVEIQVVCTNSATHFFDPSKLEVQVFRDEDEWMTWSKISDPVLHIELRKWADLMIIAPLDANTLAKLSQGLCDNLLTCIVRAWDMGKPLLFCPAMNTHMWQHPVTNTHIETLKSWGYTEIPCIEKHLACGDTGFGAMAEIHSIVQATKDILSSLS